MKKNTSTCNCWKIQLRTCKIQKVRQLLVPKRGLKTLIHPTWPTWRKWSWIAGSKISFTSNTELKLCFWIILIFEWCTGLSFTVCMKRNGFKFFTSMSVIPSWMKISLLLLTGIQSTMSFSSLARSSKSTLSFYTCL